MTEMPELWWSPTHGLMRREDGIFWVSRGGWESLRHLIGTGGYSNPEPADAIRLMPVEDNDQHIIQLAADGWTIQHPLSCRPNLFACHFNKAAEFSEPLGDQLGRFRCTVEDGFLVLGEEVS